MFIHIINLFIFHTKLLIQFKILGLKQLNSTLIVHIALFSLN